MRRACLKKTPLFILITGLLIAIQLVGASIFCGASEVLSAAVPVGRSSTENDSVDQQHGTRQAARRSLAEASGRHLEALEPNDDPSAHPEQVHIAFAVPNSPEEYAVTISWATWPETKSTVVWGVSPSSMINVVEGSSTTYSANHVGRATYTSGYLHSATITGLQPSRTYFYSCGDEAAAMSSVRSFITPQKIGGDQTVTVGILGDLGQTTYSEGTLAAIDADDTLDFVIHAGDISYADCDHPRWDSFMRMLDPIASRLPWMVAAGNHEVEAGSTGGKPFVAFENRFQMPAVGPPVQSFLCGRGGGLDGDLEGSLCHSGEGGDKAQAAATELSMRLETEAAAGTAADDLSEPAAPKVEIAVAQAALRVRERFGPKVQEEEEAREGEMAVSCCPSEWSGTYDFGNSFYSFDVASLHVVVMNPYTASGENSVQYEWIKKDLESLDRTRTPWVIAVMHCPWYNSNLSHQGERQALTAMRVMEPLMNEHKVALVITGHVHAYERSYPVTNYELSEDGPVYLVVGGAGNREGHAAGFYSKPKWSAFRNGDVFGSGRFSVRSPTKALWEWTSSEEGGPIVHDVAWIRNPFSPPQTLDTVEEDPGRDSNGVADEAARPTDPVREDEAMDVDRSSEADKKAKAALRIPGLAERSVHLSL